ncbi:MAG: Flp family type IVb pilin [Acidobacteria bacterium]|nr:Flp family type IVb pilin [Acidobacteriota bacterium]
MKKLELCKRIRLALGSALLWKDTRGQDLVEYALLAGFIAVAAGALLPTISQSISTIFSRMSSVLAAAAS